MIFASHRVHAKGPRFDPGPKHFCFPLKSNISRAIHYHLLEHILSEVVTLAVKQYSEVAHDIACGVVGRQAILDPRNRSGFTRHDAFSISANRLSLRSSPGLGPVCSKRLFLGDFLVISAQESLLDEKAMGFLGSWPTAP